VHRLTRGLRSPRAKRLGVLLLTALHAGWFSLPAYAQALDDIGRRLPSETPAETTGVLPPVAPRVIVPPVGPPDPAPIVGEGPQPFVLTAVTIRGSTVFTPEDFAPLYQSYLIRSVSVSELVAIAEAITEKYRTAGYFLSRAIIPAQSVESGLLLVDIAEAYIAEVRIEGADLPVIRERAEAIVGRRPLRLAELDGALSLIGDINGLTVTATRIEPDPADMSVHRLVLSVDFDSVQASLYVDNRGAEAVGRLQAYARATFNSAFSDGDQFALGFFTTPRTFAALIYGEAAYAAPINPLGTTVTVSGGLTSSDAGANLFGLQTQGNIARLSFLVSHPFLRSRRFSLWGNLGFDARNLRGEQLGVTTYDERLRIANASLTLRHSEGTSTSTLYAELSAGLAGAEPDELLSRTDARTDFVKAELQLSHYENIGETFGLYAAASAQLSGHPLPASEEFSVGGAQFGRAYDYWAISGDDGVSGQIELRHGKDPGLPYLRFYQLYGFYDVGWVWNRNSPSQVRDWSLASAGLGIRLTLPRSVYLTYESAWPLSETPYAPLGDSWRHSFSLSITF
jgi:hemolysin activation/secretion protein